VPSAQASERQAPDLHAPLAQSAFTEHVAPVAHGEHEPPPQSIHVSPSSVTPSEHEAGRTSFVPPSGEERPCPDEYEFRSPAVQPASISPTNKVTKRRKEDMLNR